MKNKMRAIHPGEILKDELIEIGISACAFAKKLHVPANRVSHILKGQRGITADTAFRLSLFFGTTPELWLNLQTAYDLKKLITTSGKQIAKEVHHRDAA